MPVEVHAEMAASVWRVRVAAGDTVAQGDVLVVLESMKMEIPVEAPSGGIVSVVAVGEGDSVDEGDILAVLE